MTMNSSEQWKVDSLLNYLPVSLAIIVYADHHLDGIESSHPDSPCSKLILTIPSSLTKLGKKKKKTEVEEEEEDEVDGLATWDRSPSVHEIVLCLLILGIMVGPSAS